MSTNALPLGLSFVVQTLSDCPYAWRDARGAAYFLRNLFEDADYAMDVQADTLQCVTLVSRQPMSPTMGHLAIYVGMLDDPDNDTREWVLEFDVTTPEHMNAGDAYFLYLTRLLLGRLLSQKSGVLAVFDLDVAEESHAAE